MNLKKKLKKVKEKKIISMNSDYSKNQSIKIKF